MNVRFICIFNIYKLFLYNIDNKQRECGYNEKNKTTYEVFNSFINVMVQIVEKYGKTVLQELDCAA